jgi:hypothetical protein
MENQIEKLIEYKIELGIDSHILSSAAPPSDFSPPLPHSDGFDELNKIIRRIGERNSKNFQISKY